MSKHLMQIHYNDNVMFRVIFRHLLFFPFNINCIIHIIPMQITSKQIVSTFFTKHHEEQVGDKLLITYLCSCGRQRVQNPKAGYGNLLNHIKSDHKDWEEIMKSQDSKNSSIFINKKGANIFKWLEWIVLADLPFQFAEHHLTRKNSSLDSITDETLKKYLFLVTENVEKRIANDLPDKFGIIIDGWKDGTTHYIAIFASYSNANDEGQYPLLAIAPPYDEQSFTAETHKAYIIDVLELYGKGLSSLVYLVGDNAPVNTRLSDLLEVPFIGCASHRFNLACKKYLEDYEESLSKISRLMVTLRNIKKAGKLRTKTKLSPVLRNDTRWSSTFEMLKRFFEIKEFFDLSDRSLAVNFPSSLELVTLQDVMKDLKEFESATKDLQDSKRTLLEVRAIFDILLEKYPSMFYYISSDSNFVQSPLFENGIVKVLSERYDEISLEEKALLEPFLQPNTQTLVSPTKPTSLSALALRKIKKRKFVSEFISLEHIPPTSNIVERLFSAARLVLTDYRKSMDPYTFECLMFLKVNRSKWDIALVSELVGK